MVAEFIELTEKTEDGVSIHIWRWKPSERKAIAELVVVHGYAEHGGRYRELAHVLAEAGIATLAIDLRGHGKSEGQRGFVRRFAEYTLDVDLGLSLLEDGLPRFMLGHSNGGVVALEYVAQRAPKLAGLVLSNPFLELAMPVPAPKLFVANLAANLLPRLSLPSGLEAEGISHDRSVIDSYERDPLVFHKATAGWFSEVRQAQTRVRAMTRLEMPLFFVHSDADPIAAPAASAALAAQLQSDDKTVSLRKGELHEVLNEVDRASLHAEIRDWIVDRA